MTDLEKTLIKELSTYIQESVFLEEQVKGLTNNAEGLIYEKGLFSAILSDICGIIYGEGGEGIPELLLHLIVTYVNKICEPGYINKDETWLEFFYRSKKKDLSEEELKEYKDFLKLLKKDKEWEE